MFNMSCFVKRCLWMHSKYISLIGSPDDISMESPSPSNDNNCINICNNNLFNISSTKQTEPLIVSTKDLRKKKTRNKQQRHPGQAVKLNKVSRALSLDYVFNSCNKMTLIQYVFVERKTHAKSDFEIFV